MRLSPHYSHRRQMLRHGASICGRCEGDGCTTTGRNYWSAIERECSHCEGTGLIYDELNRTFTRTHHHAALNLAA